MATPTMLVPRLVLSDRTVRRLRQLAEERGVAVAEIIVALVEGRASTGCTPQDSRDDVLFRLLLVAERFGLGVGGTTVYPGDWRTIGGLSDEKCREIVAGYEAWKRERREKQQGVGQRQIGCLD